MCSGSAAKIWGPIAAAVVLSGLVIAIYVSMAGPGSTGASSSGQQAPGPRSGATDTRTDAQKQQAREVAIADAMKALDEAAASDDEVVAITIERPDLFVVMDGFTVPTAAGVEHRFHIYLCPCGTHITVGQLMLKDYELADVQEELRKGDIRTGGVTSAYIYGTQLYIVRFEGGGKRDELIATLRNALKLVGDARNQQYK